MNAILHHISRQHGLEAEKNQVDLIENEIMDFRNGFVMLSYNPDFVSLIVHGSPLNKVLLSSNCQPHPVLNKHSFEVDRQLSPIQSSLHFQWPLLAF